MIDCIGKLLPNFRLDWGLKPRDKRVQEVVRGTRSFGEGDDPDEFDEWHEKSKELLDTAADFARWGIGERLKGVEELREVFESAESPREPEPEQYKETELPTSGPYWTIERLFEDL